MNVQPPKHQRLEEFLLRLTAAPPEASGDAALDLIATILTQVEDELTDIPADPQRWMTDGRLYPPQPDSRREVAEHPDVARYRSRAHNIFIRTNGAIEIRDLTDQVLFRKTGADGKHVWKE